MLEEQLAIVTGSWSTPPTETFSFTGSHYTLERSPALPKPAQSPLPIIVGGTGPSRTPALAAKYADEFNVAFRDEELIADRFEAVRAAARESGRDLADRPMLFSVALTTAVGADDAEYSRRATAIGREPDEFRNPLNIAGTAAEAVDKLGRIQELGADRVYLQILDIHDLEHLDFIAREVLPQL